MLNYLLTGYGAVCQPKPPTPQWAQWLSQPRELSAVWLMHHLGFCMASRWPEGFVFVFGFGHECQLSSSPSGFHPVRHNVVMS